MSSSDKFRQKAIANLERIGIEILNLATDSDIFWTYQKDVLQRNTRLLTLRSPFIDMLNRSYAHATAATIRRLTDRGKTVVSLYKLLSELRSYPELLVRDLGVENMVHKVSKTELDRDLSDLLAVCKPVKDYVDQYVAHNDKSPKSPLPRHKDVNEAINKLIETFKKYYSLLVGADIDVVVSYLEGPLAVFRFAWLPETNGQESCHPRP